MTDPLSSETVLNLLPNLLPRSTSSPLPRTTDVIAALVHAIHIALDFRLINRSQAAPTQDGTTTVSEEREVDDTASETETAVEHDDDAPQSEGALPQEWNSRGEDTYSFEYRHEQSSLVFRVRVGRMGGRVQVDATAEDGEPNSLSVVLADLVDPSAFPIPSSATSARPEESSSSAEGPAKSLGFRSMESVKTFIEKYKRDIIAKILPGLQRDGYTESSSSSGPRNPPPSRPGNNPEPARPDVPDPLLDPTSLGPNGRRPNPASIGHRDLDPQGIHPGPMGPGAEGGGMFMDFNHPLFDSRRRSDPDFAGPGGSIQPPGARWDPVGPGVGGGPRFPGAGNNPLSGMGVGDGGRWGDEMPPPGEFGPHMGIGGPRGGGGRGRGGFGGSSGFGGLGGGGGRFGGGGMGGGFGGGGGMFM